MTEKTIDSSANGCLILILPIALLIIFLFATWPLLLALLVFSVSWKIWQHYQWEKWCQQVNPIFHKLIQENRGSITALDLAMKANFSGEIAKRYLDTKAQEFGVQYRDEDQGRVYYFITASTLGGIFDDSEPPSQIYPRDVDERIKDESDSTAEVDTESQILTKPLKFDSSDIPKEEAKIQEDETDAFSSENQIQLHPPEDSIDSLKTSQEQLEQPNHIQVPSEHLIQSEVAKRLDVHSSTVYKRRDDPDFAEWSRSRDPEGIAWQYSPDTKMFSPVKEVRETPSFYGGASSDFVEDNK